MNYHGQSLVTGGGAEKPIDQILYERYFFNQKNGVALEAGANDGLYLPSCLFFEELGWKVINVEASEPNYRRLLVNRPRSENHFFALSADDGGLVKIFQYPFDNGGMDGGNPTPCTKGRTPVGYNFAQSVRYDSLIKGPVDLFVLDVEGMELDVIKGMVKTLYWPRIFCIEYAHNDIYKIFEGLQHVYQVDYIDNLNLILVRR
jgi:FkbM family methyltransferase